MVTGSPATGKYTVASNSLADTRFYLFGESPEITRALAQVFSSQGAEVSELTRLEELRAGADAESVLVAHYTDPANLAAKLPRLKKENAALRVLLLYEFTDRGKIEAPVLSASDHLLEKPFARANLVKALEQFSFRPLSGKSVLVLEGGDTLLSSLMKTLGATVAVALPGAAQNPPPELALFSPAALDDTFRGELSRFRALYADVPVLMLYDPAAAGILDSAILNEIAYLVQRPVHRRVLREKILAFFEQPQHDRRKNPRKKGVSQVWISPAHTVAGPAGIFESPFLIDISQSGLSFRSFLDYHENQQMSVWVVAEEHPDRIIDLKGVIRWRHRDADETPGTAPFKYGVEFERDDSAAYTDFARMIALHAG